MIKIHLTLIVLLTLISLLMENQVLAAKSAGLSRDEDLVLQVDGRRRTAVVHLPSGYRANRIYPLVLFLHGAGGDARQAMEQTGLVNIADRESFILCLANGTGAEPDKLTWNAWNCCGYAMTNKVDDVKFLTSLFAALKDKYPLDRTRMFIAGFSNGAMMAYRFLVEGREAIAGMAAVAGNLVCPRSCTAPYPVSVLIIHGVNDQVVPYKGKMPVKDANSVAPDSVARSVDFWLRRNGCQGPPVVSRDGQVQTEDYACQPTGAKVIHKAIQNAGHAWPGGLAKQYRFCDLPTNDLKASEVIWKFFQSLP